jgi:hypothetical protein
VSNIKDFERVATITACLMLGVSLAHSDCFRVRIVWSWNFSNEWNFPTSNHSLLVDNNESFALSSTQLLHGVICRDLSGLSTPLGSHKQSNYVSTFNFEQK